MVQYGRSCCSSWAKSARSSNNRNVVGTAIWRSVIGSLDAKKVSNWECLFVHRKQWIFLVGTRWRHQNGGKEAESGHTCERNKWKMLILTNLRRFSSTSSWDVLNVNANQMKQLLKNTQRCLNHMFLQEQRQNYTGGKIPTQKQLHGPMIWKDMPRSARKDTANWQKVEQLYKVSSPCLDDHQFKKEELESVEELSEVCSQMVLKCMYLARIGRPDIQWSVVNKLTRAITKWTSSMRQTIWKTDFIHPS